MHFIFSVWLVWARDVRYLLCHIIASPTWASYQIRKISDLRMGRERFPHHRGLTIPTRIRHVLWCIPGSLTSGFLWSQWRWKRSRHSRSMRNPQFMYLVRAHVNVNEWQLSWNASEWNVNNFHQGPFWQTMFNSLWSSDTVWRQRSGSTLTQVMTCCRTAPSHYLNRCRLIMNDDLWQSPDGNFTRGTSAIYGWNQLEIAYLKFH